MDPVGLASTFHWWLCLRTIAHTAFMPQLFDEHPVHDGLTYQQYRDHWKARKEELPEDADVSDRRTHHYLNYNWERQKSVHDAYTPSDELKAAATKIDEPQWWMVLTEPWCGDSAFSLPVIAEAADLSEEITLRILPRDENLDVMDRHLTDGSRSIPKLVTFSETGEELFEWGARPQGAAERFATLRDRYDENKKAIADLLEYYKEGGWREVDAELAERLQMAVPVI